MLMLTAQREGGTSIPQETRRRQTNNPPPTSLVWCGQLIVFSLSATTEEEGEEELCHPIRGFVWLMTSLAPAAQRKRSARQCGFWLLLISTVTAVAARPVVRSLEPLPAGKLESERLCFQRFLLN